MGLGNLLSEDVGGAINNMLCFFREQQGPPASLPHLLQPLGQVKAFPLAPATRQ